MFEWLPWCREKKTSEFSPNSDYNNSNEEDDDLSLDLDTPVSAPCSGRRTSTSTVAHPATSISPALHWLEENQPFWKKPIYVLEDFLSNMGACLSRGGGTPVIENPDGNEIDFHNRFLEDRVLGEGEFGIVKLVHDMKDTSPSRDSNNSALACKTLRKGVVFKDNTLFAPLKPEVLAGEVAMLRTLKGEHYCLKLVGVYETARAIMLVTDYCAGGEMMEYVSKQEEDLRTDDVSRIAFQMLDAVNHCAKHNIIHRDIKPENIMFQYPTPGSDLRLIDFGSGTNKLTEENHSTFAGSAFYISPEMFQRTYTQKTAVSCVDILTILLTCHSTNQACYPVSSANSSSFDLLIVRY